MLTGWWCGLTILKNDGVKVNGLQMTLCEMENNTFMFQTTNQPVIFKKLAIYDQ